MRYHLVSIRSFACRNQSRFDTLPNNDIISIEKCLNAVAAVQHLPQSAVRYVQLTVMIIMHLPWQRHVIATVRCRCNLTQKCATDAARR